MLRYANDAVDSHRSRLNNAKLSSLVSLNLQRIQCNLFFFLMIYSHEYNFSNVYRIRTVDISYRS